MQQERDRNRPLIAPEANTHTLEAAPRKLLRNGTLLIDRNGILYTLPGARID